MRPCPILVSLLLTVAIVEPADRPAFPLGPAFPWLTIPEAPVATTALDTTAWAVGATVDASTLGLPSGGTFDASVDWEYGEDADGVYLANTTENWAGATRGPGITLVSAATINDALDATGKAIRITWRRKLTLVDHDGSSSIVSIQPWNAGSLNRQTVEWGNSGIHNNAIGQFAGVDAFLANTGTKRDLAIQFGRVNTFEFRAVRTATGRNCWLTVNGRTFLVVHDYGSNLGNTVARLLWDPDLWSGGQVALDALYSMELETFASGGADNFEPYDIPDADTDDVFVWYNAIAADNDEAAYADGAFEWTVTAGTVDHRYEVHDQADSIKGFGCFFPSTCAATGVGRDVVVPPTSDGRGAIGGLFHVGSGEGGVDFKDASGELVIGLKWPDSDSAKELTLVHPREPLDLEELTGIDVTPGKWYEVHLHHGDGRPLGLVVQEFTAGAGAATWSDSGTDQTVWIYASSAGSGRLAQAVRPDPYCGVASAGTEPLVFLGIIAAERWRWALVSSYTATGLDGLSNPNPKQTTANMPNEGLDPTGDFLPGSGRLVFPNLATFKGIGVAGRSGGAFIRRADGANEFRGEALGNITWDAFFSVAHAIHIDLWDTFINAFRSTDASLAVSQARADAVVAEIELMLIAAARHQISLSYFKQVPPIDENTGGGTTASTSWDYDRTLILIDAVDRVERLVRQYSPGTFYVGTAYDESDTLAQNQIDLFPDGPPGDIHPDAKRKWYSRALGSAVRVPQSRGSRRRSRSSSRARAALTRR